MATLTKRQKQLVDFLENYITEHGYAPTLSEVGQYFGLSSLATVHKHLHNLEQKGFIKRVHNHSRALEVTTERRRPAAHELKLIGTVAAGVTIEAVIGDEATVKKYYPETDGRVRLQPANTAMEPIFVSEDDLRIRGVVVGLMRHYR